MKLLSKYTLATGYWISYYCLCLQCHDALKQQNVNLVTLTKDYVTLIIWGKWGERKGRETGKSPRATKMYHEK